MSEYDIGDRVLAISLYDESEVVGKIVKIEGQYIYIECDDGSIEKLQSRHWNIDKEEEEE